MNVSVSERELATVLAALRFWQRHLTDCDGRDISPDHFDWVEPLSPDEVDILCERFNRSCQ